MQTIESIFRVLKLLVNEISAGHLLLEHLSFLNSYLFLDTHTNLLSILDPRQKRGSFVVQFEVIKVYLLILSSDYSFFQKVFHFGPFHFGIRISQGLTFLLQYKLSVDFYRSELNCWWAVL